MASGGREVEKKSIMVVAVENHGWGIGRIRLRRVKDVTAERLRDFILETVAPGVTTSRYRHQRRRRTSPRSHAARASRRLTAQVVVAWNVPGGSSTTASW